MFLGSTACFNSEIMASSLVYFSPSFSFSTRRHSSSAQLGLMCFYLSRGRKHNDSHHIYIIIQGRQDTWALPAAITTPRLTVSAAGECALTLHERQRTMRLWDSSGLGSHSSSAIRKCLTVNQYEEILSLFYNLDPIKRYYYNNLFDSKNKSLQILCRFVHYKIANVGWPARLRVQASWHFLRQRLRPFWPKRTITFSTRSESGECLSNSYKL